MAENIISNTVKNHDGAAVGNWISQISAGNVTYDIATHHGITFKDGKGDENGVTWNGLTDLEIVIPNITDIVQTPIEFAGTVGANGEITWANGHTKEEAGSLVFITANCKFAEMDCEKGDMAIYDGANWYVVSGENQVEILGKAEDNKVTVAVGAAADVLTVEGKTLALTLDYVDLDKHVKPVMGDVETVVIEGLSVSGKKIGLKQETAVTTTLGSDVTIKQASALANGVVTLENATNLVNSITKPTFTQGTLPSFTPNVEKTFNVDGGKLTKGTGDDFVSAVSVNPVTFTDAEGKAANNISALTGLTAVSGKEFISGFGTATSETAELTIKGFAVPTNGMTTKFVEGLKDNATPVVGINAGSFKLGTNDTKVAYGFGAEAESGDVVSSVTVTANNNTSVLNEAKVDNHVLSFGSTNVASSVSTTCSYKSLATTDYTWVAPSAVMGEFATSGFTNVSDTYYKFERAQETTYTTSSAQWGLNTPALTVSTGKYEIDHTNMKATIGAGEFIASADKGTLPVWTDMSFGTTTVTGSVETALSFGADLTASKLASDTIALPGAYTLVEGEGDITVAAAGDTVSYTKATVDLEGYVTDVTITETVNQ